MPVATRRDGERARCGEDARQPGRVRELGGGLLDGGRLRRPGAEDADGHPSTFYGVHEQACEGMARIVWFEEQVPSIGIRPFVVHRPGRDHGLTASLTFAMAAAVMGEDYEMSFDGRTQLQFAPDTARVFIAAARAATVDPRSFHLGGTAVTLVETAAAIEASAPGFSSPSTRRRSCPSRRSRRRRARRGTRRDQLDAAAGGCSRDRRAAASRAGVSDESTRNSAAVVTTSTHSTDSKPPLASRIAPSRIGETAESE